MMIQIETLQGIKNLDAILTEVPDIDVVWLGTLDCRVSMNLPANGGMGGTEQEWLDAVQLFEDTLTKHNVKRAGFAFGADDEGRVRNGKRNVLNICAADVMALLGLAGDLAHVRELFPAEAKVGATATQTKKVEKKEEAKEGANGTAQLLVLNGQ